MKQRSVYINGNIHTLDRRKRVQAFAVDNGIITETGSSGGLRVLARRGYTVIDLKGKCVIPYGDRFERQVRHSRHD
jgi:predicted amidohydrolase YtcJ